jgi:L-ascorbate metabolism protein UlaG (beta-lactamase superfamily)
MTNADHSSSCMCPNGDIETGGDPAGFVLTITHLNTRIYHAGDTNVFMGMELIEELNHPNILLLPIGDRFTMGVEGAALSVSKFFKSTQLIFPMHFGTFPLLTGTFEGFKESLSNRSVDLSKLINTPE